MTAFYLSMDCQNCDEEILHGLCVTTMEHRDRLGNPSPVIPYDMASQTRFDCPRCGARNYTGDFDDIHVEGGTDPSDLDDEEEENDDDED